MGTDVIEQVVLHDTLPAAQAERAAARLPSMRPVEGAWLFWDGAYAGQMAIRRRLLGASRPAVLAQVPAGRAAAKEFLEMALAALPKGFERSENALICPDGARVEIDEEEPLETVGRVLQQDVCILEKQGSEHVLTGAVLCFPASWTLAEKIGHPLLRIHGPVPEYDAEIAKRVQRIFDGVQVGRPMWRANLMRYEDPALFHPRTEDDPRPNGSPASPYMRSERQTVLRLPQTGAVAFVIHTYVVRAGLENEGEQNHADKTG